MNDSEILVRPPRATGPILLMLFGLALFALSVFVIDGYLRGKQPMDTLYYYIPGALLGLLLCLTSAAWWVSELSKRCWLTITREGFTLRDRTLVRQVTDDQVLSTSFTWKHFHFNGSHWWSTLTHNIWIAQTADDPTQLTLIREFTGEARDPLVPLIERLNDKLIARAKTEWERGQVVFGEGWALDQQILRITPPKKETIEVALASVEATDVIDNELHIWTEGREEPLAKITIQAANISVLQALLAVALRGKQTQPVDPESGRLGRMLFQWRPTVAEYHFFLILGIFVIGVVTPCLFVNGPNPNTYFMVFGSVLVGLLLFTGAYNTKIAFFRYHELGIHRKTILSDRKLRFAEVDALTFCVVRQFFEGFYGGTVYVITFDPLPEPQSDPVVYRFRRRIEDLEMDKLRDHLSMIIGARMIAKVNQGENVPWTKNASFRPEGLEFVPASLANLLLPKPAIVIPYEEIAYYHFRNGVFYLFSYRERAAVLTIHTYERNFYPGLVALVNLRPGLEFNE